MSFISCHAGCDELVILFAYEKPLGVDAEFSENVFSRIVMRHYEIACCPKLRMASSSFGRYGRMQREVI
jgi:hypothetical protein